MIKEQKATLTQILFHSLIKYTEEMIMCDNRHDHKAKKSILFDCVPLSSYVVSDCSQQIYQSKKTSLINYLGCRKDVGS